LEKHFIFLQNANLVDGANQQARFLYVQVHTSSSQQKGGEKEKGRTTTRSRVALIVSSLDFWRPLKILRRYGSVKLCPANSIFSACVESEESGENHKEYQKKKAVRNKNKPKNLQKSKKSRLKGLIARCEANPRSSLVHFLRAERRPSMRKKKNE
jgi:hypothetical protein